MNIHLGYEVGTGKAVEIPLRHVAVTGQTQLSGKTTTLEALISRSGLRAVAFVTKRAEGGFQNAHEIQPYFRERADWQFVASILEATLRERLKFQRPWIMKVCRGARTLADVSHNVDVALATARGLSESIYTELQEYLKIVTPQIARLPYSKEVRLSRGINVMDLGDFSTELQSLVIRSVLEWVYEREQGVITIIPEAWEFIPQKRGSPVLYGCEQLIRKGAAAKNFVWLDSQDIAGVHKDVLRQVGVWILGVQREANEVKRTLAHLPIQNPKPKAQDVMTLSLGEFYVCYEKTMVKCYVQPAWGSNAQARAVAVGEMGYEEVRVPAQPRKKPMEDDAVWKQKYEEEHERVEFLRTQVKDLDDAIQEQKKELARLRKAIPPVPPIENPKSPAKRGREIENPPTPDTRHLPPDPNGFYESFKSRLLRDAAVLSVLAARPEIEVRIDRPTIRVEGGSLQGRIATLIAEGWLDQPRSTRDVFIEGRRRFNLANPAAPRLAEQLSALHTMGFLVRDDSGNYQAVEGMKVRIIE